MAFCSNCGAEIPDGVRFCANCGANVGGETPVNSAQGQVNPGSGAPGGAYVPRPGFEQAADQTRAFVVQPLPEPEPTGIDKFGKFFWIPLVILTIVDFISDPAILTIILSAVIIGGAIFALSRKYKFKGFAIVCLILAAICLLCGVSQAKKQELFTIPGKTSYSASADNDEDYEESASAKDSVDASPASGAGTSVSESKPADNSTSKPSSDETKESDSANIIETGGVDPDLKAFLDSYEKFVDEYVDFMKKYMANPTDLSLLGEYTDMMSELSDFETKLDKYDSKNMSTEDAAYYLEVTTRCTQKMLEIL